MDIALTGGDDETASGVRNRIGPASFDAHRGTGKRVGRSPVQDPAADLTLRPGRRNRRNR